MTIGERESTMVAPSNKPHAVFLPFPAQSHIKGLLILAKLLHRRGIHITFVNTELNHRRFLRSQGSDWPACVPADFQFVAIPDGLPHSDPADATQDPPTLIEATKGSALTLAFTDLVRGLGAASSAACGGNAVPPVSCVVSDGFMPFALDVAHDVGVPFFVLFTIGATSFMCLKHYRALKERGLTPLKDESHLTNGFLDITVDCIPSLKGIRLRDLPSSVRTTDPNDLMFEYVMKAAERARDASAIILHTFDALERGVLDELSSVYQQVFAVGPLQLHLNRIGDGHNDALKPMGYSLWKEDSECLRWLDTKEPGSVVYVNFGSIAVMTSDELVELAWGLARSDRPFLWIIRPDMVKGDNGNYPEELVEKLEERKAFISRWCPQEAVLSHPSVGGFVTHCGWNSVLESLTAGVPMLCRPCFAEQRTNAWLVCENLGVGLKIESDARREDIAKMVGKLMDGMKAKSMREKAAEWKRLADDATGEYGSSTRNFEMLVSQMLGSS